MPRQPIARPGETNHDFVDGFFFAHCAVGLGLALLGVGPAGALGVAVGWELLERQLKDHVRWIFPVATQDTLSNLVGDVVGVMLGWLVGTRIKRAITGA
jgi:hypothetical protein